MLDTAVEKVIAEIERLSSEQQREVLEHLEKKMNGKHSSNPPIKPRIVATNLPIKDRSKENAWLAQHRDDYAGQWVALDGDRLLGHGKRFKEVAKTADDAGVPDALIFIVEENNKAQQPDFTPRIIGKAPPPRDRSREYEWLEQHRKEYSRQWVALDGSRLISSNTDCRIVIDEARQRGVPDALIVYVEAPDALPLII
jgi:hypothetical protein